MKKRKPTTPIARISIKALECIAHSASNDVEYGDENDPYVRKVNRAIDTAWRAIKKAKLEKGIFD